MFIDFKKVFLASTILVRVITSLSVNVTTTTTAAASTTDKPVVTLIENGQQNLTATSNSSQITLTDIENSFDLIDNDLQVRFRGKRCIRHLLTEMLNLFCSKYQIPTTPTTPTSPSVAPARVQPIHVHIHDKQEKKKKPSEKKVTVEDYDDEDDKDYESEEEEEEGEDADNEDEDYDDSDEDDQDDQQVEIKPEEVPSEKRLLKRLKKLEHKYDKMNAIEERELAKKSGKNHRRRTFKVARNTQYVSVKRKILSFDSRKKRVRLLVQLNKSFKKVISTQKKIHAIHKSSSRKSHKPSKKHQKKSQ